MPAKRNSSPSLTRREFLKTAGVTLAAGALSLATPNRMRSARTALPEHPNFLFLISDQERYPQHWPVDWDYANKLPGRQRLLDHGLSFRRAYCNSAMCSPSRAGLFTGLYTTQHEVSRTLTYNGSESAKEKSLPLYLPNLATILAYAGYHVSLKGKWHLSKSSSGGEPTHDDLLAYGFQDWEPTTAGEATDLDGYGGGCAGNDIDIAAQAVQFLQTYARPNPFALVVGLVNPHDVLAYPLGWNQESCSGSEYKNTADLDQGILLSDTPSYAADDLSTKPACQSEALTLYNGLGIINPPPSLDTRRYLNFYAYLHTLVDQQIVKILDALDNAGLTDNTIIVRLVDHGEIGLAHGGLRQKMFCAYEEAIHLPLIFSNPQIFPDPQETDALTALVDVLPTVVDLANIPDSDQWRYGGQNLAPVLANPATSVQSTLLYTFDDENAGLAERQNVVKQPNHIRCIRSEDADGQWKYARYFDPAGVEPEVYEMYDLENDPDELDNVAHPDSPRYEELASKRTALAQRLAEVEADRLAPLPRLYLPLMQR